MKALFQVIVARAAGLRPAGVPIVEPRPMARFEVPATSSGLESWGEAIDESSPRSGRLAPVAEAQPEEHPIRSVPRKDPEGERPPVILGTTVAASAPASRSATLQTEPAVTSRSRQNEPMAVELRSVSEEASGPASSGHDRPPFTARSETIDKAPETLSRAIQAGKQPPTGEAAGHRPARPSAPAAAPEPDRPAVSAPNHDRQLDVSSLPMPFEQRGLESTPRSGELSTYPVPPPASRDRMAVPTSARPVTVSIGRIEVSIASPGSPQSAAKPPRSRGFSGYERVRRGQR